MTICASSGAGRGHSGTTRWPDRFTRKIQSRDVLPRRGRGSTNEEKAMAIRFLTTSAVILLIAGPAFADCSQEIESLKEAVTEAETGASTTETGMPATKHQEQVLAGDQQGDKAASGAPRGSGRCPCVAPPGAGPRRAGGGPPQGNRRPTSSLRRATWLRLATRKAACRRSPRRRIFLAWTRQAGGLVQRADLVGSPALYPSPSWARAWLRQPSRRKVPRRRGLTACSPRDVRCREIVGLPRSRPVEERGGEQAS